MAEAFEDAMVQAGVQQKLSGWVNVPADCVRSLKHIHLHAGRPAGVNEPMAEGVAGSQQILEILRGLTQQDLCVVLISGGGSALLPAPQPPLTLQDKQATTRFLMTHGATIQELNTVRKRLSFLKGGGLARVSGAGQLVAMIISDIVGDPLDMIASGPTVADPCTDQQALDVLQKFQATPPQVPQAVFDFLENAASEDQSEPPFPANVHNHIIGNNETAMLAAATRAEQLGYEVRSLGSDNCGEAAEEGRMLARLVAGIRDGEPLKRAVCVLSGGEPVVHLAATDQPRRGGRNQELVLAGLAELEAAGLNRIVLLSGGTDGEDGPTDAAGAWADASVWNSLKQQQLQIDDYLAINNSYPFFQQVGGLLKTGPTHTNVMDLRVALVDR